MGWRLACVSLAALVVVGCAGRIQSERTIADCPREGASEVSECGHRCIVVDGTVAPEVFFRSREDFEGYFQTGSCSYSREFLTSLSMSANAVVRRNALEALRFMDLPY